MFVSGAGKDRVGENGVQKQLGGCGYVGKRREGGGLDQGGAVGPLIHRKRSPFSPLHWGEGFLRGTGDLIPPASFAGLPP